MVYKSKKTVYIPIEIKVRELASQVLLAGHAALKGFRVYIGTKPAIADIIQFKGRGGIYLYKGCHPLKYMKFIDKKCDAFVVLDQEVGPVVENYKKIILMRFRAGTTAIVDRYYSIGPMAGDIAKKTLKNLRGKVVVTGWPRIDLWRNKFKSVYSEDIQKYKDKYGDFILFSSDFGSNSKEKIKRQYRYSLECGNSALRQEALAREKASKKIYAEFKKFVQLLKKWDNDPDIPKIIVRPHPAEDIAAWKKELKELKKTLCVYQGDITAWVYAAKGVLHRGCTTAVQSFMSKVPTAYFVADEDTVRYGLPYKLSTVVRNTEEFKNWIKNIEQDKDSDNKNTEELRQRVLIKDKLAAELIVEDFAKLDISPEKPWESQVISKILVNFKQLLRELKKYAMLVSRKVYKIKSKNISPTSFSQKVPGGIKLKEVVELLNKMFPEGQFKVHKSVENCVLIEGK